MPRPIARPSRLFIEYKLSQGYSPSAILEAHNYLTRHHPRDKFEIEERVYSHRKLSKSDITRAYDRWRVQGRRKPSSKEGIQLLERKTRNQERIANYRLRVEQRESLGLPPPPPPIQAADAGMVYRITHQERWREHFEEGSP